MQNPNKINHELMDIFFAAKRHKRHKRDFYHEDTKEYEEIRGILAAVFCELGGMLAELAVRGVEIGPHVMLLWKSQGV